MSSACRHVAHCCTPAFLYLHSLTVFPQTSVSPRWGCLSQSAAARLPLGLPLSRPSGAAGCRTSSRRRFAYKAPREGIVTGEGTPSLSLEDRAPEDLHIPVLAAEVAEVFRGVKGGIHRFIDGPKSHTVVVVQNTCRRNTPTYLTRTYLQACIHTYRHLGYGGHSSASLTSLIRVLISLNRALLEPQYALLEP